MDETPKKDHVVFTFGRFNPPTTGHSKLVDRVKQLAHHKGADHVIFASATQDAKKNPLSHKVKTGFMTQMFPGTHIHPDSSLKTPIDVMKHLSKQGYKKATMVVGDDRVKAMSNLLLGYNGKDYTFDELKIVSAGHRDPDADGVEGMSGSKMRDYAFKSDFKKFSRGVPNKQQAKELYSAVRKGLKMNESTALFLVGGPGSGKDFLVRNLLESHPVEIALSKLFKAIKDQEDLAELNEGSGVIINGNADQQDEVILSKIILEAMGYKTAMVYVYTTDEESKSRNDARIAASAKTISEEVRQTKYTAAVEAMQHYSTVFGDKFTIFNNSHDIRTVNEETRHQVASWMNELRELIPSFYEDQSSLDEAFAASVLGERDGDSRSEYYANRALNTNKTTPHKAPKKQENGLNNFFAHRAKMDSKTNAGKKINEAIKKKILVKAARPPSAEINSTVDGGAATQAFGAHEEFDASAAPVFEDWGVKGERVLHEGRAVSLNKPYRSSSTGYSVFVENDNDIVKIDFQKGRKSLSEGEFKLTQKEFWETFDVTA